MSTELIYGIHAVSALLERQPERFLEAWVLKGREDERLLPLLNELQRCGVSIQLVTRKTLDDKAEGAIHQGIIARILEKGDTNAYTIEKKGIRKMIYQTAWRREDGTVGGIIELSMPIPAEMPHYVRG